MNISPQWGEGARYMLPLFGQTFLHFPTTLGLSARTVRPFSLKMMKRPLVQNVTENGNYKGACPREKAVLALTGIGAGTSDKKTDGPNQNLTVNGR